LLGAVAGYHLGRAGGWQGPLEGPIARARQSFRAPHQGTQDRGGTGGAGSPRNRFFFESPSCGYHLGRAGGWQGPPEAKGQLRVLGLGSPRPRQHTESVFFWIRTLESIGLPGPTESDSSVDSGSWVKKIGLPRGLGLLGPNPIGLSRGFGLMGPKPIGLFLGLRLGDPRPVGLWFGLGLLVWSGLGSGGRPPPPRAPPPLCPESPGPHAAGVAS
jgi:hypothetical protein